MATAKTIDLTNVKDGGGAFNKRRMPAGDYPARITKVADAQAKEDKSSAGFMWLFTIEVDGGGTYPYYCKLVENQLWKVRNLCLAAGMQVPKKKLKLDPEKLVGKRIAVTLEDDEYEGKAQSVVNATFPLSELLENADDDDDDDDDDDGDDDEEETPPPAKKAAKKKAAPVAEDDDDDEEDEDEDDDEPTAASDAYTGMDRKELKEALKILDEDFVVKKSMTDDDLRTKCRELEAADADDDDDEEDEPEPPKKKAKAKKKAKVEVTDDELEELDIDDI
jgi:hypothetical protein